MTGKQYQAGTSVQKLYGGNTANRVVRTPDGVNTQWGQVMAEDVFPGATLLKVADYSITAGVASLVINSLPTQYNTLLFSVVARSDNAGVADNIAVRLGNGGSIDSTVNYDWQQFYATGNTVTGNDSNTGSNIIAAGPIPGAGAPSANYYGRSNIWLPDLLQDTKYRSVIVQSTMVARNITPVGYALVSGGTWRSTLQVTDIEFLIYSGSNFAGTSRVRMWGLP